MDLLQDRLFRARASGASFMQSVVDAPWGLRLPADTQLAAHAMIRGDGWLWFDDPSDAIALRAGDLALVRGTQVHHLANWPGAPCVDLTEFLSERGSVGSARSGTNSYEFLCGAYRFAGDVGQKLLETLPPVFHARPRPGHRLRLAVDLLSQELSDPQPGQQTVLDRLLDIVLVHMMREHFDDPAGHAPDWYAANAHPTLGPALRAMHSKPGIIWTVTDLARLACMSRATFARTFQEVLRQTPMQYLTEWRMTLARDDLRSGGDSLATIASRYGYGSPYAFSAAFNRRHGAPPGRFRRDHSQTASYVNRAG